MTLPTLPRAGGVGLKPEHFRTILDTRPSIGFFEVHAENYMVDGGPFHYYLERIRANYPLSIHGVGLSIGGEEPLDERHLDRLAKLIARYQPESFSEHLAWSSHQGIFLNDLLPIPYHSRSLKRVCEHIERVQERLGRKILLENPASYIEYTESTMSEVDFIRDVIIKSGCGLLLDVNNAYISCINHGRDVLSYIRDLPLSAVGEIHLAGYAEEFDASGAPLLIDAHGSPVTNIVWDLYCEVIAFMGPQPTLVERDNDIPAFVELAAEARHAELLMLRNKAVS